MAHVFVRKRRERWEEGRKEGGKKGEKERKEGQEERKREKKVKRGEKSVVYRSQLLGSWRQQPLILLFYACNPAAPTGTGTTKC